MAQIEDKRQKKSTPDMIRDMVAEDEQALALYGNGNGYVENAKYVVFAERCSEMGYVDLEDEQAVYDRTERYMKLCVQFNMKPSMPSYALALGITVLDLENMLNDRRNNRAAIRAIGRGVSLVEAVLVNAVIDKKLNPVTAIFMLKNHFGYKDQTEIALRGNVSHTVDKASLESKYQAVIDV